MRRQRRPFRVTRCAPWLGCLLLFAFSPDASAQVTRLNATQFVLSESTLEDICAGLDGHLAELELAPNYQDGAPNGVRITRMVRGSPFGQLGLRQNDVLLASEGRPIVTADDLGNLLAEGLCAEAPAERLQMRRRGRERILTWAREGVDLDALSPIDVVRRATEPVERRPPEPSPPPAPEAPPLQSVLDGLDTEATTLEALTLDVMGAVVTWAETHACVDTDEAQVSREPGTVRVTLQPLLFRAHPREQILTDTLALVQETTNATGAVLPLVVASLPDWVDHVAAHLRLATIERSASSADTPSEAASWRGYIACDVHDEAADWRGRVDDLQATLDLQSGLALARAILALDAAWAENGLVRRAVEQSNLGAWYWFDPLVATFRNGAIRGPTGSYPYLAEGSLLSERIGAIDLDLVAEDRDGETLHVNFGDAERFARLLCAHVVGGCTPAATPQIDFLSEALSAYVWFFDDLERVVALYLEQRQVLEGIASAQLVAFRGSADFQTVLSAFTADPELAASFVRRRQPDVEVPASLALTFEESLYESTTAAPPDRFGVQITVRDSEGEELTTEVRVERSGPTYRAGGPVIPDRRPGVIRIGETDSDVPDATAPSEVDESVGYLGVSSSPPGIVWVDGVSTEQETPARRIQLEPGRHEVQVFYGEHETFSEVKTALIRPGVNTNVFFRFRVADDEPGEP